MCTSDMRALVSKLNLICKQVNILQLQTRPMLTRVATLATSHLREGLLDPRGQNQIKVISQFSEHKPMRTDIIGYDFCSRPDCYSRVDLKSCKHRMDSQDMQSLGKNFMAICPFVKGWHKSVIEKKKKKKLYSKCGYFNKVF